MARYPVLYPAYSVTPPIGLAAVAGALSDWDDLEEVVEEIYAARKKAKDRSVPDLE